MDSRSVVVHFDVRQCKACSYVFFCQLLAYCLKCHLFCQYRLARFVVLPVTVTAFVAEISVGLACVTVSGFLYTHSNCVSSMLLLFTLIFVLKSLGLTSRPDSPDVGVTG
jgi:hypothetical protein